MGKRVLPTVQVLSEWQKHERRVVEVDWETPRNKNTGAQDHQKGCRGEEWSVQLTESAKGQLSESAGVADVHDAFSWCWDFNRRRCRMDGSWPKLIPGGCPYIGVFLSTVTHTPMSHDSWLEVSHSVKSIRRLIWVNCTTYLKPIITHKTSHVSEVDHMRETHDS